MVTTLDHARAVASAVNDPEVPVLTIADLGVLRDVTLNTETDTVTVTITPTYSGCPAMETIRDDLHLALEEAGFTNVIINLTLTPAWTTDWMTPEGKLKLTAYGIAPPTGKAAVKSPIPLTLAVKCPRCSSLHTRELSRFGSTSCKSLWQCDDCLEPFDHFKNH